jgi:hypothetical protein
MPPSPASRRSDSNAAGPAADRARAAPPSAVGGHVEASAARVAAGRREQPVLQGGAFGHGDLGAVDPDAGAERVRRPHPVHDVP